jgi:hypothetical protein
MTVDALDSSSIRGRSSMVEPQPSKLIMPVRSRSAALFKGPAQRATTLGIRPWRWVRNTPQTFFRPFLLPEILGAAAQMGPQRDADNDRPRDTSNGFLIDTFMRHRRADEAVE